MRPLLTRRHVTTTVTMLVLCGVLVVAAAWGWDALFPQNTSAGPETTCATRQADTGKKLRTRQVRVSVYNAGNRAGLAGKTMRRLEKRGFKSGDVGNAPESAKVRKAAVWAPDKGDPAARLVARQLGKKTRIKVTDTDLGPGVDVLVGNKLRHLRKKAPRTITVKTDQKVCSTPSPSPQG